jgi:hypothetical protein
MIDRQDGEHQAQAFNRSGPRSRPRADGALRPADLQFAEQSILQVASVFELMTGNTGATLNVRAGRWHSKTKQIVNKRSSINPYGKVEKNRFFRPREQHPICVIPGASVISEHDDADGKTCQTQDQRLAAR